MKTLVAFIWEFLVRIFRAVSPKAREADRREKLRKRLHEKIKKAGWK
jgi:hypothetical protein